MSKLFFVGAGKMATAIAGGLVRARVFAPEEMEAFDVNSNAAAAFSKATNGVPCRTDSVLEGVHNAEAVLLAVKPQMLAAALAPLKGAFAGKLVITIVAGVPMAKVRELCGAERIIRVMPNTPALAGGGAAAFAADGAAKEDEKLAQAIFSSVGIVERVREVDLDAVTALSGSGPAYVFEFIQALADGGVAEGLSRDTATKLAIQTVLGSAMLAAATGEHPTSLKDKVTSPGGTTSRALEFLADRGFSGIVMKAVRAAAQRSRELGKL